MHAHVTTTIFQVQLKKLRISTPSQSIKLQRETLVYTVQCIPVHIPLSAGSVYFLEPLCGFSLMMWDVVFVLFISVVRVGSDSCFLW